MKTMMCISAVSLCLFIGIADSYSQYGRRQWASQRNYNPATVETLSGQVRDVVLTNAGKGRGARGIHLNLAAGTGSIEVHLGPASFIEGKMSFAKGDTVTVEGSKMAMGSGNVIIAKKVTKGSSVLVLRNDDGTPLWAGYYGRRRGGR
ncbi:MAG TPA: DNA-binding protein [Spirochaetota bacterium]|nr:DNA-binding protein [Spirochaetota bacterium]